MPGRSTRVRSPEAHPQVKSSVQMLTAITNLNLRLTCYTNE